MALLGELINSQGREEREGQRNEKNKGEMEIEGDADERRNTVLF